MIREFLNRRKRDKTHVNALFWNKHHDNIKNAEEKIKNAQAKMLSSPCAINNMDKCDNSCVHFKEGFVSESVFCAESYVTAVCSRCQLWV